MAKDNTFKLKVRDTTNLVFEGEVDRISSYNSVGPFDVYYMHANFISIINKGLAIYKDGEKIKEIEIEQAVLKVKNDVAKVFLGLEISSPMKEAGLAPKTAPTTTPNTE